MFSEKDKATLATTTTILSVVSALAARIQNPNAVGVNAAIEHKVATTLVRQLKITNRG